MWQPCLAGQLGEGTCGLGLVVPAVSAFGVGLGVRVWVLMVDLPQVAAVYGLRFDRRPCPALSDRWPPGLRLGGGASGQRADSTPPHADGIRAKKIPRVSRHGSAAVVRRRHELSPVCP